MRTYQLIENHSGAPVKAWTQGVPVDDKAWDQLKKTASLPIIHGWVAAMPDVHVGIGATVGSVVPTIGAVIPAAVGVDIGCGMTAMRTTMTANDLPESLKGLRTAIEMRVPVGFNSFKRAPKEQEAVWARMGPRYEKLRDARSSLGVKNPSLQLGTLGTGNHFIEVCLDEENRVWFMLHSGSRGLGNKFGTVFIEAARERMRAQMSNLPDRDLAYFSEGSPIFDEYIEAVSFAQEYAKENRRLMMIAVVEAAKSTRVLPQFKASETVVDCHHNYVSRERHFDADVLVTRKGAVRAGVGEMGIIPGSMGARSFIVRGKGNAQSFESCSHGAGRVLSRTQARNTLTIEQHIEATRGVECRKDRGVLDETPAAYKPIEAVMAAQEELVEIVHTLRQVVCVKG